MPECQNCGAHLTPDYARVLLPDDADVIEVCPHCPDRMRTEGGGWREARSHAARGNQ